MTILNTLTKYLRIPPLKNATDIVVAYSGGVDSHVLLHALSVLQKDFAFNLKAIHIHHGLSPFADDWLHHCAKVCDNLQVQFQSAKVQLKNINRTSLEALAREERYKKIVELAPNNAQVLLAQHQDDQLETFMLQLKRGAGPKGLSAMNQAWKVQSAEAKSVSFYRPLLAVTQQQIMEYAQQHQLNWCEDESNLNTNFERNFLRHEVLPVLLKRWPELATSVSRSAFLCSQQQALLDEVCAEKLATLQSTENSVDVEGLIELSNSWLHQVVRYWLSLMGIQSPSLAVLNNLRTEVLEAADDATPVLQWQNWQFRRFNQQLYVVPVEVNITSQRMAWSGQAALQLPANLGTLEFCSYVKDNDLALRLAPSVGKIEINVGSFNTRFKPKGANHSKPLKQWFKQWKIPPWERQSIVQILQNDKIIALLIDGEWLLAEGNLDDVKSALYVVHVKPV